MTRLFGGRRRGGGMIVDNLNRGEFLYQFWLERELRDWLFIIRQPLIRNDSNYE